VPLVRNVRLGDVWPDEAAPLERNDDCNFEKFDSFESEEIGRSRRKKSGLSRAQLADSSAGSGEEADELRREQQRALHFLHPQRL